MGAQRRDIRRLEKDMKALAANRPRKRAIRKPPPRILMMAEPLRRTAIRRNPHPKRKRPTTLIWRKGPTDKNSRRKKGARRPYLCLGKIGAREAPRPLPHEKGDQNKQKAAAARGFLFSPRAFKPALSQV